MTRHRDDSGAVAIVVAVFALVMFGFAALVVDLGLVRVTRAEAESAADAAALAAAGELYDPPSTTPRYGAAVSAVKQLSQSNYGTPLGDWQSAACTATVPAGWYKAPPPNDTPCITFDHATQPARVQVQLPVRHVGAAFGGLVGYSGADVSALAKAQVFDTDIRDCSLCLTDDLVVAAGDVEVTGGGSLFAADAWVTETSGSITVKNGGGLGFENTPSPNPPSPRYDPQPVTVTTADPFATASMPSSASLPSNDLQDRTCSGPLNTGLAFRDLTVDGNCTVTGGTLVVTGDLRVLSGGSLTATGATIFLTCVDPSASSDGKARLCGPLGEQGGELIVQTGGTVTVTGSSFGGFGLLYDRGNGSAATVGGTLTVTGSHVYKRLGFDLLTAMNVWPGGRVTVTGGTVSLAQLGVGWGEFTVNTPVSSTQVGPPRLALVE